MFVKTEKQEHYLQLWNYSFLSRELKVDLCRIFSLQDLLYVTFFAYVRSERGRGPHTTFGVLIAPSSLELPVPTAEVHENAITKGENG